MKIRSSVVAILLIASLPTQADIDYKHYVQLGQMKAAGKAKHGFGAELLDYWLDGTASGMSWTAAAGSPAQRVFCLPERMALSGEVLNSVIRQFLDVHPNFRKSDEYMGTIAVLAVKESFPCPN